MDAVENSQISQPVQPVQPVPVEPKKKSNLLLIVILVIAILLVGVGGVYAGMQIEKRKVKVWTEPPLAEVTPQPTNNTPQVITETITVKPTGTVDETSNWKTYKNDKYGFEFQYPEKNYTVEGYSLEQYDKASHVSSHRTNFEKMLGYPAPQDNFALSLVSKDNQELIRIWVFNNIENLSIDDWYKKYMYFPESYGSGSVDFYKDFWPNKAIKIGNLNGLYNMATTRGPYAAYVKVKGSMFLVEMFSDPSSFDQILSTFKFTN